MCVRVCTALMYYVYVVLLVPQALYLSDFVLNCKISWWFPNLHQTMVTYSLLLHHAKTECWCYTETIAIWRSICDMVESSKVQQHPPISFAVVCFIWEYLPWVPVNTSVSCEHILQQHCDQNNLSLLSLLSLIHCLADVNGVGVGWRLAQSNKYFLCLSKCPHPNFSSLCCEGLWVYIDTQHAFIP